MKMLRRLLFFIFDLRQCFTCGVVVGEWNLLDNTYPHSEAPEYLHYCHRCYDQRKGIRSANEPTKE